MFTHKQVWNAIDTIAERYGFSASGLARKAGLDVATVVDTISKGAAQSWQMENRGHTMADGKFDFGFAVEWMVKDLGFVIDEARRNGSSVPVTETVLGYYRELMGSGSSRLDTSSLITRLTR